MPSDAEIAGGSTPPDSVRARRPFNVMAKPIGPQCNLDCRYCFYLEKAEMFPGARSWKMPDRVLEHYIKSCIEAQPGPEVFFAWQGGEPTLLGVNFFERVVALQKAYCPEGKWTSNALQTNGTLLDDKWGRFLKQNDFLVGLSIDGPRKLHDRYRRDKAGRPSFDRVMHGREILLKHGVRFNLLCVVNRANSRQPLKVYRFLRSIGDGFIQFIPIVERRKGVAGPHRLAGPSDGVSARVTEWSVRPGDYGRFLCAVFDEWVRKDMGRVFVQLFDVQFGILMGQPSSLCVYGKSCGDGMAMEHNGDVYACDHYVYPEYRRGNIMETPLAQMLNDPAQRRFGGAKHKSLPAYCRACEYHQQCWGECPKHRFLRTENGEPGLNYLCKGLRAFFAHTAPCFAEMAALLRQGLPPALLMEHLRIRERG